MGLELISTTKQVGAELDVYVRDTGVEIMLHALSYVFDRFYQEDASRAHHGAGLGLAIAQEDAAAQGGKISIRSQLGQGTAISVRLPLPQKEETTISTRK
jgi:signal transduction histidine kinase